MGTDNSAGRRLIAGAFCDFLAYLSKLPDPIIVGEEYPSNRLVVAFNKWAESRGFNTVDPCIAEWRVACEQGRLK